MAKKPIDNSKKAEGEYASIASTKGQDLGSLIQAVKAAQAKKTSARPVSKKEKARLQQQEREAKALEKVETEQRKEAEDLIDKELEIVKQDQQEEADRLRREKVRQQRVDAVRQGRQRIQSNVNRFKGLLLSFEQALKLAQMGVLNEQKLRELRQMYMSVVSAFSALPTKLQYDAERKRIAQDYEILGDLVAIYEQEQEPEAENAAPEPEKATEQEQKTPANKPPKTKRDWEAIALNAMKGLKGGLGNAARMTKRFYNDQIAGRAEAYVHNARTLGSWAVSPITAPIKLVKAGLAKIGDRIDRVKDYFDPYFEKFGSMFRSLMGYIRKPLDIGKKGMDMFGSMLGWGALLTSVLGPILSGVNKYLEDRFGEHYIQDFIVTKFNETKTWLLDKFTSWFEQFFQWGKDKVKEFKEGVTNFKESAAASPLLGGPGADISKPNGLLNKSDQAMKNIRNYYESWKNGNMFTRIGYGTSLKMNLPFVDPNAIPPDLKAGLIKDGFLKPGAGGVTAPNTGAGVPQSAAAGPQTAKIPSSRVSVAAQPGPPMDGKGSSPVLSSPMSMKTSESSPSFSQASGTSSGMAVGQIHPNAVGDSMGMFNLGLIGG